MKVTTGQILGGILFLVSYLYLFLSHYVDWLQICAQTPDGIECRPADVALVGPAMLLALLLIIPDWSELSVFGTGLKRALTETKAELEETKIWVERTELQASVAVLQNSTVPTDLTPTENVSLHAALGDLQKVIRDLEDRSGEIQVAHSVRERIGSFQRIVSLAEKQPDVIGPTEIAGVTAQARRLLSSLESRG